MGEMLCGCGCGLPWQGQDDWQFKEERTAIAEDVESLQTRYVTWMKMLSGYFKLNFDRY